MVMKLEYQKQWEKSPFLARQMLEWFYDTSTDTATGVVCYGS
jgi:hypothetical protein